MIAHKMLLHEAVRVHEYKSFINQRVAENARPCRIQNISHGPITGSMLAMAIMDKAFTANPSTT